MIKANKFVVNFYQYMGLDPLHNSFINPLLRKLDKITSSIVIVKYNPEQENVPFNGKYIQLTLGNTIEQQKAYSIYLYKMSIFHEVKGRCAKYFTLLNNDSMFVNQTMVSEIEI